MTEALGPEPAAYLAALRRALSDLPADECDDLLVDVEASLSQSDSDGGEGLLARLGPPDRFAAELRSAAGIPVPAAPAPSRSALTSAPRDVRRRLDSSPMIARARPVLRELSPIWWLVRAYAACAVLLVALGGHWDLLRPFVPLLGSARLGAAIVVLAAIASVVIGVRMRRGGFQGRRRASWAALNVGLAIAAVPALVHAVRAPIPSYQINLAATPALPTPGLNENGLPAQNIYAYTRTGHPLYDVLLYDGFGMPLDITTGPDPQRRVLMTSRGLPVYNSFPIRYYQPGTNVISHPAAAPPIARPKIVTPPLALHRSRR